MEMSNKLKKQITTFNVSVFFFAIMTGYLISKSPININVNEENLESSALRVAKAFEVYNEKRFRGEEK